MNSQITNKGLSDCRHILVDEEWPVNYSDINLTTAVDLIMIEWQQLRGDNFYFNHFDSIVSKQYNTLRIMALDFIYKSFYWGFNDLTEETIKMFKFRGVTNKEQAYSKYEQIIQKMELDESEAVESKIIIFEDLLQPIEEMFKVQLDYNITVAKYESWNKRYKQKLNG